MKSRRQAAMAQNYESIFNTPNVVMKLALDSERGQFYWVEQGVGASSIRRANLDGSDQQDLVTGIAGSVFGFALDVPGGKIYWSNSFLNTTRESRRLKWSKPSSLKNLMRC